MKLLIVEDNTKLRKNIITFLKIQKIIVEEAFNWEEALNKVISWTYDCIILDVNMPVMNGIDFLKTFRWKWFTTPVIALTSNSELEDKEEMYNLWVDDYLTKPFELKELLMRLNALVRRWSDNATQKIIHWDYVIDTLKHKIYKWSEEVVVYNKEFLIIEYLLLNKWIPKTKTDILDRVWWEREGSLTFSSVTLEAHISWIRKKFWKEFIKTIKGVWYLIE